MVLSLSSDVFPHARYIYTLKRLIYAIINPSFQRCPGIPSIVKIPISKFALFQTVWFSRLIDQHFKEVMSSVGSLAIRILRLPD